MYKITKIFCWVFWYFFHCPPWLVRVRSLQQTARDLALLMNVDFSDFLLFWGHLLNLQKNGLLRLTWLLMWPLCVYKHTYIHTVHETYPRFPGGRLLRRKISDCGPCSRRPSIWCWWLSSAGLHLNAGDYIDIYIYIYTLINPHFPQDLLIVHWSWPSKTMLRNILLFW